ncbi:MAG: peptidase U32 family protein [Candidatus Margulisiibacteriota bacterium]
MIQLSTFCNTQETLQVALASGATHLILEDSKVSVRSFHNDFACPNFDKFLDLANIARAQHPEVDLAINIDLMAHNRHFGSIDQALQTAQKASISTVRVQDIGVMTYVQRHHPSFKIDLATETGNNNIESLGHYAKQVQTLVLTNEQPAKAIAALPPLACHLEVQVHGPMLIQYSNRRYMAGFQPLRGEKPIDADTPETLRALAEDLDYPGRAFPFYDNPHGHFMFLYFDRCLIGQIDTLSQLPLQRWLVDARGESLAYLETALNAYRIEHDRWQLSPNTWEPNASLKEQLETIANRPLRPGFFKANQTDQIRQKPIPIDDALLMGEVVDVIKNKQITVQVKRPLATLNLEEIVFLTPTQEHHHHTPIWIRTLTGQDWDQKNQEAFLVLPYFKGIFSKTKVYASKLS